MLQYLHGQGVIYRDVKPENVLFGLDGYLQLSDFGLSKPLEDTRDPTYSFCGSPEYMAPEMLLKQGHNAMVDFYCLGALLYEMVFGLPPFYCGDYAKLYRAIVNEQITLPDTVEVSPELRDIIHRLLEKNPA